MRGLLTLALALCAGSAAAQVKISAMPAGSALTGPELIPMVQGARNATTTPAGLQTYIQGRMGTLLAPSGTITVGHCAQWTSSTTLGDSGSACCVGGGGGGGGTSLYAAWSNFPQAQSFIPLSVYYLHPTGVIDAATYNGTFSTCGGSTNCGNENEMLAAVGIGVNMMQLIAPTGTPYPENTTTDNGEAAAIKAAGIYVVAGEGMLYDGSVADSSGVLQSSSASHRGSVADIESVFANAGASANLVGFNAGDEPTGGSSYPGLCSTLTNTNLTTMKGYDTTRLTMYNTQRWFVGNVCSGPPTASTFQKIPSVASYDDYTLINSNDYAGSALYNQFTPSDFATVNADSMFLEAMDIQASLANNAAGQPQWVFLSGGDDAQGTSGLYNCIVKTDDTAANGALILTSGSTKVVNNSGKSKFTAPWVGLKLLDQVYNVSLTFANGNGTTATLGFYGYNNCGQIFTVGSEIAVAGLTPSSFNGTYTVTASSANSVSYANTTSGASSTAGTVASTAIPAGTSIASIIGSVANGVDGCTQAAGCTEATMSAAAASSDAGNLAFLVGGEPTYGTLLGGPCVLSVDLCLVMGNEFRVKPSEVNATAWLAFISNANGVEWFCHDSMGDAFCLSSISSYNVGTNGYNLTATQAQNELIAANAAAANLKTVDAGLSLYGAVLNDASTAFCNMDTFVSAPTTFSLNNASCTNNGLTMAKHTGFTVPGAAMLKTHAGIKYLIAQATRRGSGSYDFTVPGGASQTATVVYDSDCQYDPTHAASTVTTFTGCAAGSGTGTFVLNGSGQFTDALGANGDNYQTKIYRVQ